MSIRTVNTGIHQVSGSCWLASILQAIVDCPPLVEYIFQLNNKEIMYTQNHKREIYTNILKKIIRLRNKENEIFNEYSKTHNYKSFIFEYSGEKVHEDTKVVNQTYIRNYPDTTILAISRLGKGDAEQKFVSEVSIKNFLELRELPLERWLGILTISQMPLELLIKRKMIGWTLDELINYAMIFNELFNNINRNGAPFLWVDPDFNNLLKSYLYALIFNNDNSKCLYPQYLRKYMFESMNDSADIIESEIRENFVQYVYDSWLNPLNFLSVIFKNFEMTNDKSKTFPFIPGSFVDSGTSIRLPHDMNKYNNLQEMLQTSELAKNILDFDFLIINNPAIENRQGGGIHVIGRHHFITNKQININGNEYILCSVIIYKGGSHYITLTPNGIFNDSTFTNDSRALDIFCQISNITDIAFGKPTYHPGYLWFYKKNVPQYIGDDRLMELKNRIEKSYKCYNDLVPYEQLFIDSRVSPIKISLTASLSSTSQVAISSGQVDNSSLPVPTEKLEDEEFNFKNKEELEMDNKVLKYFLRFNIPQINYFFNTTFKSNSNAHEFFTIGSINKHTMLYNEKFKELKKQAETKFLSKQVSVGSGFTSVLQQSSFAESSTMLSSSGVNDVLLSDGSKVHDSWLKKSSLDQSYYELYKDELADKIFNEPMTNFIQTYGSHTSTYGKLAGKLKDSLEGGYTKDSLEGGYTKYKKYLKYKNKYLQIKRFEK